MLSFMTGRLSLVLALSSALLLATTSAATWYALEIRTELNDTRAQVATLTEQVRLQTRSAEIARAQFEAAEAEAAAALNRALRSANAANKKLRELQTAPPVLAIEPGETDCEVVRKALIEAGPRLGFPQIDWSKVPRQKWEKN